MYLDFLRKAYSIQAEVLDGLDRPEAEDAYRGLVATATDLVAIAASRSRPSTRT